MKKLLFPLFLILLIFIFSCEKPSMHCWKCSLQEYKNYYFLGMPVEDTTMCNKSTDFIYKYELNHTYSDNKGNGMPCSTDQCKPKMMHQPSCQMQYYPKANVGPSPSKVTGCNYQNQNKSSVENFTNNVPNFVSDEEKDKYIKFHIK